MPSPTLKQEAFVREYIKNKGNGTQAILKTYNTTDPKTASVMAVETLASPSVREQLDKALAKERAKLDSVVDNIASIAVETPVKGFSGADVLEANKTLLKLHGVLTERKVTTSYNINADLAKLSKYDLIQLHKKKTQETQAILDGEIEQ